MDRSMPADHLSSQPGVLLVWFAMAELLRRGEFQMFEIVSLLLLRLSLPGSPALVKLPILPGPPLLPLISSLPI